MFPLESLEESLEESLGNREFSANQGNSVPDEQTHILNNPSTLPTGT